jgi:hypothetical protein
MRTKSNYLDQSDTKSSPVRTILITAIAVLLVAAGVTVWAEGGRSNGRDDDDRWRDEQNGRRDNDRDDERERHPYAIGLWGDLPYSDVQTNPGVPNLINDMNSQDLAFTVHDGDLKAGSAPRCDDILYANSLAFLNSLKAPAMFTPGDNDWTDCDRPANGGYNSLERLDHERKLFFDTSYSLGQHRMHQQVQTSMVTPCLGFVTPSTYKNVPCVENRRWTVDGVTYATLNIQGSCNNLCDTTPDPTEYAARNTADIAWMQQTFDEAKDRNSAAVMFISQADPGFNNDATATLIGPFRNPRTLQETDAFPYPALDGFHDFLVALRTEVIAFRKPVAYVHGDSHYFRIDKPFRDDSADAGTTDGRRLENFTRVETFGDNQGHGLNDVHWLKVFVDPHSREVFSYQPQMVPGNRVAVPAP